MINGKNMFNNAEMDLVPHDQVIGVVSLLESRGEGY